MISNSVILRQRSSTLTGLIKRSFAAGARGKFYGSSDSLLPTYLPKPGSGNLKKIQFYPDPKLDQCSWTVLKNVSSTVISI